MHNCTYHLSQFHLIPTRHTYCRIRHTPSCICIRPVRYKRCDLWATRSDESQDYFSKWYFVYVNKYDFCSVELLWLTVVFERALCTAAPHQLRCWFDRQLILICSHSNAECENVLLFSNESNWVNCELVTWILCWANWNFSLFSTDCRHLYASMSVLCRHKIHSQPFSSIDRTSFHFGWESWAQLTHIAHCTRADCIVLAFVGSELFGIQRDFPVIRFVKYALREFRK